MEPCIGTISLFQTIYELSRNQKLNQSCEIDPIRLRGYIIYYCMVKHKMCALGSISPLGCVREGTKKSYYSVCLFSCFSVCLFGLCHSVYQFFYQSTTAYISTYPQVPGGTCLLSSHPIPRFSFLLPGLQTLVFLSITLFSLQSISHSFPTKGPIPPVSLMYGPAVHQKRER